MFSQTLRSFQSSGFYEGFVLSCTFSSPNLRLLSSRDLIREILFIYLLVFILARFFPLVLCCILDLPHICNFAGMTFSSAWMNSYSLGGCVYQMYFMKPVAFYLCCLSSKLIFLLQSKFAFWADLLSLLLLNTTVWFCSSLNSLRLQCCDTVFTSQYKVFCY